MATKKKKKKAPAKPKSRADQIKDIQKKAADIQKSLDKSVKSGEVKKSSSGGSSSSSSSNKSTAPTVNYTYDSKKETEAQYNARIEKERAAVNAYSAPKPKEEEKKETKTTTERYDTSVLIKSDEFKTLNPDDQEAVLAVFDAIASNDQVKAKRLAEAFKASSKINDVYFGQKLRLAADEIERGYVEIDKEADFKATQAENRLADIRKDYASKKDFMSLEEASTLKDIEREYTGNLETLQTGLAEAGFTSSSRRIQKEKILDEATGSLRESKQRGFAYERGSLDETLGRSERDTQKELNRLAEITKAGKLDFLRSAEKRIGTQGLQDIGLPSGTPLIGGVYGELPEEKLQNTISSMQGLVF